MILQLVSLFIMVGGCSSSDPPPSVSHGIVFSDSRSANHDEMSALPDFSPGRVNFVSLIPTDDRIAVRIVDNRLIVEPSSTGTTMEVKTAFDAATCAGLEFLLRTEPLDPNPQPASSGSRTNLDSLPLTISVAWKSSGSDHVSRRSGQKRTFHMTRGIEQRLRIDLADSPYWFGEIGTLIFGFGPPNQKITISRINGIRPEPEAEPSSWKNRWRCGSETRPAKILSCGQRWKSSPLAVSSGRSRIEFGWASADSLKSIADKPSLSVRLVSEKGSVIAHQVFHQNNGLSTSSPQNWEPIILEFDTNSSTSVSLTIECRCEPHHRDEQGKSATIVFSQPVLWPAAHGKPAADDLIILVSIDTLRADHLGCYGYPHGTSPEIDRFSRRGTTIVQAITPYPSTAPAHASLFTGLFPFQHGLLKGDMKLPLSLPTLATRLLQNGFHTCAVTGGGNVSAFHRFDQGFLSYDDGERSISSLSQKLLPWIQTHPTGKRFVFYHTYEVHAPFFPHQPITEYFCPDYTGPIKGDEFIQKNVVLSFPPRDIEYLRALYDSGIRVTDAALGVLIHESAASSARDPLIIVTSDHGEHFAEHDLYGHGNSLYSELLEIPLIIAAPGKLSPGSLVHQPFSLIDIPPTLLALSDLPVSFEDPGRNMLPLLTEHSGIEDFPRFSEVKTRYGHRSQWVNEFCLITKQAKLILTIPGGEITCFRLPSREMESDRIQDSSDSERQFLEKTLQKLLDHYRPQYGTSAEGSTPLDRKTERLLQALGYLTEAEP